MTRREFPLIVAEALGAGALAAQSANASEQLFYRPPSGRLGDIIPFFRGGRFQLFYLQRGGWSLVSTDDFLHYTEHGEVLPRGGKEDQDSGAGTGSVIEARGQFHLFYCGISGYLRDQGKPFQAVMHAVGDDLLHWRKIPEHTFFAPLDRFEMNDWRDPHVVWDPEAQEYLMLITGRLKTGPPRRRGCTALFASKDLVRWEAREPLYAPGLFCNHECNDIFQMGDWWYLIFSENCETTTTRYRMARSRKGPWITPVDDAFDCRAYYAAKSVSDGRRRYLCGWCPARTEAKDSGQWVWGGTMVVHQLRQLRDGTLGVQPPDTVTAAFAKRVPFEFRPALGRSTISGAGVEIQARGTFGAAAAGDMPDRAKLAARLDFDSFTRGCGFMLRTDSEFEAAYYLRLEPGRKRLVFDRWPRTGDPDPHAVPFMPIFERPVEMKTGEPVDLTLIVDRDICVVYVNGEVAMSVRIYDLPKGGWCVFALDGVARFQDVSLAVM
jgi:beta-fructofuranosidase